jgi:hypothetical protein
MREPRPSDRSRKSRPHASLSPPPRSRVLEARGLQSPPVRRRYALVAEIPHRPRRADRHVRLVLRAAYRTRAEGARLRVAQPRGAAQAFLGSEHAALQLRCLLGADGEHLHHVAAAAVGALGIARDQAARRGVGAGRPVFRSLQTNDRAEWFRIGARGAAVAFGGDRCVPPLHRAEPLFHLHARPDRKLAGRRGGLRISGLPGNGRGRIRCRSAHLRESGLSEDPGSA